MTERGKRAPRKPSAALTAAREQIPALLDDCKLAINPGEPFALLIHLDAFEKVRGRLVLTSA